MSDQPRAHGDPPWYQTTTPAVTEPAPWYNSEEAAVYLRVTVDLIRRRLKYEIPYRQNGKGAPMFFHRVDLDRWAAATTVQPIR